MDPLICTRLAVMDRVDIFGHNRLGLACRPMHRAVGRSPGSKRTESSASHPRGRRVSSEGPRIEHEGVLGLTLRGAPRRYCSKQYIFVPKSQGWVPVLLQDEE